MFDRGNIVPWPNVSIHRGFNILIRRTFDKTHADLGLTCSDVSMANLQAEFESLDPDAGNPRDKFEKAMKVVTADKADPDRAGIELMTLANQAYHYNFGLCLRSTTNAPISVDTIIGSAFEDLLDLDEVYEGILEQVPVMPIPKNLPFHNGPAFIDLIDDQTTLGLVKHQYLRALNTIFTSPPDRLNDALKDVRQAARDYVEAVSVHFGSGHVRTPMADGVLGAGLALGFGTLTDGLEKAVELGMAAAAPFAGMSVTLAEDKVRPREFLLRKIRTMEMRSRFDPNIPPLEPDKYFQFKARELKPAFSSVAFNAALADDFVKQLPLHTG